MGWGRGTVSQKSLLDTLKIRSALEVQDVPLGMDVRGHGLLRLQNMPLAVQDVRVNQGASSTVLLRSSLCAWVVMDSALAGGCGRLRVCIPSCLQLCSTEAVYVWC